MPQISHIVKAYLGFFPAQELEAEGKNAIESPVSPTIPDHGPEMFLIGKFTLPVNCILGTDNIF